MILGVGVTRLRQDFCVAGNGADGSYLIADLLMKSRYDIVILGAGHPPSPRLRRDK